MDRAKKILAQSYRISVIKRIKKIKRLRTPIQIINKISKIVLIQTKIRNYPWPIILLAIRKKIISIKIKHTLIHIRMFILI